MSEQMSSKTDENADTKTQKRNSSDNVDATIVQIWPNSKVACQLSLLCSVIYIQCRVMFSNSNTWKMSQL